MAQLTERITARRLNERIPVRNPEDELGHMALVLNGLLERLQESFEKLQRFTSDVSHELRTPLAAVRSVGEVGLQQEHDAEEYRDIIGSMLEEVAKLTAMIDTLLTIAHADSGAIQLQQTTFAPMDLVQEAVAVIGVLAEEKEEHPFGDRRSKSASMRRSRVSAHGLCQSPRQRREVLAIWKHDSRLFAPW